MYMKNVGKPFWGFFLGGGHQTIRKTRLDMTKNYSVVQTYFICTEIRYVSKHVFKWFLSNSPIFFSLLEVCFIFQVKALNSIFFMLLFLFIGCIIFSRRKCSHIISSSEVFLVFIELFAMNYGHMKTFYS